MDTPAALARTLLLSLLAPLGLQAQQFEAVYSLEGVSSSDATAAMEDLFADPDMQENKATLYAADFGVGQGTHKIVVDYDNYDSRDALDDKRRATHGWSRYLLRMHEAEFVAGEMAGVVRDFGGPRHTAGYLLAYLVNVQDPAMYVSALDQLNKDLGNPGVLRLVAMRTGDRGVTHAVLIGGDNFAAVQKYMDRLYASDAFRQFAEKVNGIRSVIRIEAYQRLGAWGY